MRKTPQGPEPPSPGAWRGLAARLAVGTVLVVAGILKASAPAEEFAVVIESYQVVSPEAALPLAAVLPWVELWVGFSLIAGYLTRLSSAAGGALFMCFIGALAAAKARGIDLPHCGCFGSGWHPDPNLTLALDLGLLMLCVLAYRRGAALWSLDRWAEAAGEV